MAEQPQKPSKAWVKLCFEAQNESSTMPPELIGKLQQETPTHYVLSNVLEFNERTMSWDERHELDFFSKTYVWRCSVLGAERPRIQGEEYDDEDEEEFTQYGGTLG